MQFTVEDFSPDAASAALETTINRRLRPAVASFYAEAMRRGEWSTNTQPVAFDKDGRLRDGQHRMAAVVLAGLVVRFAVFRDCSEEELTGLDCGIGRTDCDRLVLSGTPCNRHDAAAAKICAQHAGLLNRHRKLFDSDLAHFLTSTADVLSQFSGDHISAVIRAAAIWATAGDSRYTQPSAQVINAIRAGSPSGEGDWAVARLIPLAAGLGYGAGTAQRLVVFGAALRVIFSVSRREKLGRLVSPDRSWLDRVFPCPASLATWGKAPCQP